MAARDDGKTRALAASRTLNPHPEKVTDPAFGPSRFEELAGQVERHVGLEEHAPDVAQPLGDGCFAEHAAAGEAPQGVGQLAGQLVEHSLQT